MTSNAGEHIDKDAALPEEPQRQWTLSPKFQQIVAKRVARRDVMQGSLATAIAGFFGPGLVACGGGDDISGPPPAPGPPPPPEPPLPPSLPPSRLLGFTAVPPGTNDTVVIPPGYVHEVILPWGTAITGHLPPFALTNTGADQAVQIGMHHDGMHFFPLDPDGGEIPANLSWLGLDADDPLSVRASGDGLLVMNHEYIEPRLLHASMAGSAAGTFTVSRNPDNSRDPDHVLKEMNAHGVSISRIRKNQDGRWELVIDPRNRRITALTPMAIAGPLRGHGSVVTRYSPDGTMTRGTFNNCAHGFTPWGTYLACEENWWFYFRNTDPAGQRPASQSRYGIGSNSSVWHWDHAAGGADHTVRFDATRTGATGVDDYRNEPHCHGWVTEIDPFDPGSTPVKRTHLGRFSHEGAVFGPVEHGRPVVVYMGDDTTDGYIFKFVSAEPYHPDADGSILDAGTLYAARFGEDGSGVWLALTPGQNNLTPGNGWPDLASILLNARGAGDAAGATPMDRPEWGAVDRRNGRVYFTLTNNPGRATTNAANPRANNIHGHIIRWREHGDDHAALSFTWEIFALGGDQRSGRDHRGNSLNVDNIFGSPDGLWADPDGRLWIQTDATDNAIATPGYATIGNNQMLCADTDTGEIRRFLTGPVGQEITGCIMTPDQRTLFVNVQHPGAGMTSASAFQLGNHASNWPDGGDSLPRSATVVIRRADGGRIGT